METKHTPGPWQAKAGLSRWNVTTTGQPRTFNIAAINTDRTEQAANARLIAAAPELLEAVKVCRVEAESLRRQYVAEGAGEEWIERQNYIVGLCDAAIANATGETK